MGQHVRLSMLDAVVSFLWAEGMAHYTFFGEQHETHPAPARIRDMVFETADGFITAGANSDVEWRGHGTLAMVDAIKCSCDCYFYEVARRTGVDRIAEMANRFGLGNRRHQRRDDAIQRRP